MFVFEAGKMCDIRSMDESRKGTITAACVLSATEAWDTCQLLLGHRIGHHTLAALDAVAP